MNNLRARISLGDAALAGLLLLLGLVVAFPHFFAAADPLTTNTQEVFLPPSLEHPLGTDQTGRDVFARVVYGARSTVLTGLIAAFTAAASGAFLGALAAFFKAFGRSFVMRLIDAGMALPEFLIALLIIAYTGPGVVGVTLAVALATTPGYVRLALVSARSAITSEAHIAAKVLGVSRARRLLRYIMPAALRPIIGVAVLGVGFAVLTIAGLTFLGLGLVPPDPDWGAMLSQSKLFVKRGWWALVFPGIALIATVCLFIACGKRLQKGLEGAK